MNYRTRQQWGATYDPSHLPTIPLPATYLFVHHNVIAPTDNPNADMERTEQADIARFGKPSYKFAIHPSGIVLEGMGDHRSPDTYGYNDQLSVMFMGNYQFDTPTDAAMFAGRELVAHLLNIGWMTDRTQVWGHRDVYATVCPGANLYPRIGELLTPPGPIPSPSPIPDPLPTEETGMLTSVVLPDGTVVVHVVGLDSGVYEQVRKPDGTHGPWTPMGGRVRGDIANKDITLG